MNAIKVKRIASEIARELSIICGLEAHDSLLKEITITGVEVTNDLGLAKVFFTSVNSMDHKKLEKELNDDTAGYLRTQIANRIELRHTPELRFQYDESIEYGDNIEKIIEEIHAQNENEKLDEK